MPIYPRYFLKLAYKGTNFHGWQVQANAHSVQAELNIALSKVLHEAIYVYGAGRTDTGVHAAEMYAHFDCSKDLIPGKKDLMYHINCTLNKDVSILDILRVRDNANARFDAIARTYKYQIIQTPNPFLREFAWYVYGNLDIEKMNKGAATLLGSKDFKSFSKGNTQVSNYFCNVQFAEWKQEGEILVFTIRANRFLRNMVRAIVGTLVGVGKDKITFEQLEKIVEGKDRAMAGFSVPAQGLSLVKIEYKDDVFINE
ncbi:MAG: tRNA pseudouridine synthase A [Bacteroidia bacterium]|nr:tRNA pseudouridine synthase A [Bacteroidia bacterium]